jgi:hypothetical protein
VPMPASVKTQIARLWASEIKDTAGKSISAQ